MQARNHHSVPAALHPRQRPDSRTLFQQNQHQFQESIACNHRGPNGVLYNGELCEICFCRMNDVPLETVPLNVPRSHTAPGIDSKSPLDQVGTPAWVRKALTPKTSALELNPNYRTESFTFAENRNVVAESSHGTDTVGSRIFPADPADIFSTRSDPRNVMRVPAATQPEFAGADTIARLNDDPVSLSDLAFGGEYGSVRGSGTRRMKFDPPVKPLSMKSIEKRGVRGFLRRAFGRKRT